MTDKGKFPEDVKGCNREVFPCVFDVLAYIVVCFMVCLGTADSRQSSKCSTWEHSTTLSCSRIFSPLRVRYLTITQLGEKIVAVELPVTLLGKWSD